MNPMNQQSSNSTASSKPNSQNLFQGITKKMAQNTNVQRAALSQLGASSLDKANPNPSSTNSQNLLDSMPSSIEAKPSQAPIKTALKQPLPNTPADQGATLKQASPPPTQESLTAPKTKSSKKIFLSIAVLLFLVFGAGAGFILSQQSQDINRQATTPETAKPTLAVLPAPVATLSEKDQIAKKVLTCLDGMKDNSGLYPYKQNCDEKGNCESLPDNNSGPRPIYARFHYYQKTKDPQELAIFKKDLSINNTAVSGIQNNFYNCKLIAEIQASIDEMWNNNFLMKQERNQARNICLLSKNNQQLEQIADQNLDSELAKKPDFDQVYDDLSSTKSSSQEILLKTDLASASYYSSEYAGRYSLLTQNRETELKRAIFFYNQALLMLFQEKQTANFKDICTFGESSLDLYRVTQDEDYLKLAKYLWSWGADQTSHDFSTKTICAYFTNSLYQETQEESYQTARSNLINDLIENNLDKTGQMSFVTGDGCFNSDKDAAGKVSKSSIDNSLLVKVLLAE
jgi:hypothetical protein